MSDHELNALREAFFAAFNDLVHHGVCASHEDNAVERMFEAFVADMNAGFPDAWPRAKQ